MDIATLFKDYPDVLTVSEAQKALSVGRNTIYKLLAQKSIKSLKIGKVIRIPKPYLIDFITNWRYNDGVDSVGVS